MAERITRIGARVGGSGWGRDVVSGVVSGAASGVGMAVGLCCWRGVGAREVVARTIRAGWDVRGAGRCGSQLGRAAAWPGCSLGGEAGNQAGGELGKISGEAGAQILALGAEQKAVIDQRIDDPAQHRDQAGDELFLGHRGWMGFGFGHALITAR